VSNVSGSTANAIETKITLSVEPVDSNSVLETQVCNKVRLINNLFDIDNV